MASSPRKTAPSTFNQTWHETDTAVLDPTSLPLPKAPRAWDRKVEKTLSRDGREKKVWRRYALRSQPANTTSAENEDDPQEGDSRNRAVKKLRVRSDETVEAAPTVKDKQRAFRGTRWDRRKSMLPRKKTMLRDQNSESTEETTAVDETTPYAPDGSDESAIDWGMLEEDRAASEEAPFLDKKRRESPFIFTVEDIHDERNLKGQLASSTNFIEGLVSGGLEFEIQSNDVSPQEEFSPALPRPQPQAVSSAQIRQPTNQAPRPNTEETISIVAAPIVSRDPVGPQDDIGILNAIEAGAEVENGELILLEEGSEADPQSHGDVQEIVTTKRNGQEDNEVLEYLTSNEKMCDELSSASATSDDGRDAHMSEVTPATYIGSPHQKKENDDSDLGAAADSPEDITFTEQSLQLEIQREMDIATQTEAVHDLVEGEEPMKPSMEDNIAFAAQNVDAIGISNTQLLHNGPGSPGSQSLPDEDSEDPSNNIAAGLTLTPALSICLESPRRQLRSPTPPPSEAIPDDATITMHLDEDTALLKDFISRAAVSKANKAASIARRSSLQNRRDSDAVRHALASPRKILEDKDPNSPSKYDNDATLDLSQTLTLNMDQQPPLSPSGDQAEPDAADDTKPSKSSRRSSRTRKSRLPAPSSGQQAAQMPKNIAVRRADGGEPIVLKRTEAQELGLLTRANTRKNKQGAVTVSLRLLKINAEPMATVDDSSESTSETKPGRKNVRWDETLAYYQEDTGTTLSAADMKSLETPDELSLPTSIASSMGTPKAAKDKSSTPKSRRIRGLGAANGTPGKGLLAPASLLPEGIVEEKQHSSRSKIKRMPVASASSTEPPPRLASPAKRPPSPIKKQLPSLEVTPVGIDLNPSMKDTKATKEKKSRLATPRRVKLPQPNFTTSVPVEGKENHQSIGIKSASPKKGLTLPSSPKKGLPPPQVSGIAAVETGLPRRRAGRRL
ncbi:hypothetical protein CC78DRAFT_566032 [Lojkania enalia]|uniref:Uncharacterized protein n=1 Tax=Lojkania enalia TaxID=147567 RepID=A0A9P4KIZ2_9PLEO|nr:hypothetical protein CC78DRAFT_566032 [Didymosphaeria enalia]